MTEQDKKPSKHDAAYLARHDVGESALFDLGNLRDIADDLQRSIEYASRRYEHVSAGGAPDDHPDKWTRVRKPCTPKN